MNVSVKGLIFRNGKVLLLKPKNPENSFAGWDGPGGNIKEGESFLETLKREVFEETRLRIKEAIPFKTLIDSEKRTNYLVFLCTAEEDKVILSKEHTEYRWLTPQELYKLTKYNLTKELKKFIEFTKTLA